jgi:DNA-binding response OmpR family regulator
MADMKYLVLVVEDDEGFRNLITTILRVSGYDVVSCADADEALALTRENGFSIHLLIADVNLGPYMDGIELAQNLRADFPALKVLYISGREERQEILLEVAKGLAKYLAKPFKPSAMTHILSLLLDSNTGMQAVNLSDGPAHIPIKVL